jgi:hypothetical protein
LDHAEALKHLQTLINVATKADNPDVTYRILVEMVGVIYNALPPSSPRPDPHTIKRPSHLRSVK